MYKRINNENLNEKTKINDKKTNNRIIKTKKITNKMNNIIKTKINYKNNK